MNSGPLVGAGRAMGYKAAITALHHPMTVMPRKGAASDPICNAELFPKYVKRRRQRFAGNQGSAVGPVHKSDAQPM